MSTLKRVAAAPLIGLLLFYQRFISPLTPPTCRYYPSCSTYALTAIRRFGPVKGTWLALRRLGRCHPWAAGGVDHVPGVGTNRSLLSYRSKGDQKSANAL